MLYHQRLREEVFQRFEPLIAAQLAQPEGAHVMLLKTENGWPIVPHVTRVPVSGDCVSRSELTRATAVKAAAIKPVNVETIAVETG